MPSADMWHYMLMETWIHTHTRTHACTCTCTHTHTHTHTQGASSADCTQSRMEERPSQQCKPSSFQLKLLFGTTHLTSVESESAVFVITASMSCSAVTMETASNIDSV